MFCQVAPAAAESSMWNTPRSVTAYASRVARVGLVTIAWTAEPSRPAEMSTQLPLVPPPPPLKVTKMWPPTVPA